MSKRYGRTQKRKAKERIAQLTEAYETSNNLLRKATIAELSARRALHETITTIESVCKHSVAIPAKRVDGNPLNGHYRMAVMDRVPDYSTIYSQDDIYMPAFKTVDLYHLKTFLREHTEELSLAVHAELSGSKQAAYMISEKAFYCISEEVLTDRIIPDIARALIQHLRRT